MSIHIAAIYLLLTIPLGNIDPISLDFGVYPAIGTAGCSRFTGMATPVGYWYSTECANSKVHEEELLHIEQMEAMGPWMALAYVIDPRFFEPYETDGLYGTVTHVDLTLHNMWRPPAEIERQFPQFRVTFNPGNTDVQFLPGYRWP